MVTPISEIAIRLTDYPAPFMLASYMALLGGFLAMAAALSIFHRKRPPWTAIATLAVLGLITRIAIWGGTRDDLIYELAFQLPLALGILLCSHTAFRTGKGQLNHTLAGLFLLSGLNFFIKPFVAAALGSGQTARDYAGSAYALYSQASTAILLTAAGLTVLLIVIQTTIQEYVRTAETDHLSGLLNRRGFDRQAQALLASAPIGKRQLCAMMIDLDHFKRINDCFGHDMGDRVIQAFADILRSTAPKSAHLARTGGEEFVILLNRVSAPAAGLIVEAIAAFATRRRWLVTSLAAASGSPCSLKRLASIYSSSGERIGNFLISARYRFSPSSPAGAGITAFLSAMSVMALHAITCLAGEPCRRPVCVGPVSRARSCRDAARLCLGLTSIKSLQSVLNILMTQNQRRRFPSGCGRPDGGVQRSPCSTISACRRLAPFVDHATD